jgi:hypothetical protein
LELIDWKRVNAEKTRHPNGLRSFSVMYTDLVSALALELRETTGGPQWPLILALVTAAAPPNEFGGSKDVHTLQSRCQRSKGKNIPALRNDLLNLLRA